MYNRDLTPILRDVRFGIRILRRHPSFAAAAIGVMALGVGATSAVFSVLRGVLITPLPYREPSRLVLFRADLPGLRDEAALTSDEFSALQARSDLFDDVAAAVESDGNLTSPDDMAPLNAVAVSETFLQTLGVAPVLGRAVRRGDAGARPWSIDIGYELWQTHFHADSAIVGRTIEINNNPMTVVGILPRGFRAYLGAGVALPVQMDVLYVRGRGYDDDPFRGNVVIARLKRGVGVDAARAALDTLAKNVVSAHPERYRTGPVRLSLAPVDQEVVSEVKPALVAAAGAVAFVLVVACANLANLLLARASARAREMAVRVSIGASRGDIIRQLMAEGIVVGACGASGGWIFAHWGVVGLLRLAPSSLPRREAIAVDGTVAVFAIVVAVVCAIAVSLVPAWQAAGANVSGGLREDSSRSGRVTRGALVAAQLALSVVLLVGAGLMTRAFASLRSVPLGFDPHHAASMYVSLQGTKFGTGTLEQARAIRREFYERVLDQARNITGVRQIGAGFPVPMSGISMPQRVSLGPDTPERQAEGFIAFAGYLQALDVPIVAGRYFAREDDAQPVVVVDQRLAEDLWPGRSAVGRRLMIVYAVGPPRWTEVVGVVAHVQSQGLRAGGSPQVWMTYAVRSYAQLNLIVRAANPIVAAAPVARLVQDLGSGRPVRDITLLDDAVAAASADTRFALFVFGIFAALGVLLAGIGVYGVVSYAMSRRTREIAVRLALGASPRRLVGLVLRDGAAWTVLGLAGGLSGAAMLTRYLESLLFRVGPHDVVTFGGVALLLAAVALGASLIPALQAMRVDPMRALRSE